jgi:hypothetical protein
MKGNQKKISDRFWDNKENQRIFLNNLGKQLGFQSLDNWYNISKKQIEQNGGNSLLRNYYGASPSKLVKSVYSEHSWNEFKFSNVHNISNEEQRNYLEELGNKLGIRYMDDWYNITQKLIMENGGSSILQKYKGSPSKMLLSIYPNYPWVLEKFRTKISEKYWENKNHRIDLIKNLTKKLQISDLNDWARISLLQISQIYGHMDVFKKYPLQQLLVEAFPNFNWNLNQKLRSSQRFLRETVQKLFPQSGNSCLF